MRTRQLGLPLAPRPDYARTPFLRDASNDEALAWLARPEQWPAGRLVLWGEAGCGKTHLAHRWAAERGAPVRQGAALAGPPTPDGPALCIDAADAAPERPLLHALNLAAERRIPALLTAREAPARWPVALADLASRLRASGAVRIAAPDDAFLRTLFLSLLTARTRPVPEPVVAFLLRRLPRSPEAMREAALRADRIAYAHGTGLTRAVAAELLASFEPVGAEPGSPGAGVVL